MYANVDATMNAGWQRTRPLQTLFLLLASWQRRWCIRRDTRRGLAQLDNRLLSDIGITPAQRNIECMKWFWQK